MDILEVDGKTHGSAPKIGSSRPPMRPGSMIASSISEPSEIRLAPFSKSMPAGRRVVQDDGDKE